MLWVLVDEDVKGLNDAAFCLPDGKSEMDGCARNGYHNGGCGFAFADGHSETHHWLGSGEKLSNGTDITNPLDYQDWLWMRERTSADSTGTMTTPPSP